MVADHVTFYDDVIAGRAYEDVIAGRVGRAVHRQTLLALSPGDPPTRLVPAHDGA
jgi:hypothetical protein